MKKFMVEFLRRGAIAAAIGPMVLVVVYLILQYTGAVDMLSANEVCIGILSLTALAFVAGGMNAIYQIEQLPLLLAILIHGAVLYSGYLGVYILNDWLEWGFTHVLVFSVIFVVGYLVIWAIIYAIIKKKTKELNEILKIRQQ